MRKNDKPRNRIMALENVKECNTNITVGSLFRGFEETAYIRNGLGDIGSPKEITDKNIHRPGLALAGYVELFTYDRVQILECGKCSYLNHLTFAERIRSISDNLIVPCILA